VAEEIGGTIREAKLRAVDVILTDENATSSVIIYCDKPKTTGQGKTSRYEATSDPKRILRPGQSRRSIANGEELGLPKGE